MLALLVVVVFVWLGRIVLGAMDARRSAGASVARVSFRSGSVTKASGPLPRHLYNALVDVVSRSGASGDIVVDQDGHVTFAATIPEGVRQQILNVLYASRVH